jgi:hypothetical protein
VNACRLRRTQQGSEIIHILNGIEDEQKRRLIFTLSIAQNVIETRIFTRLDNSNTSLMYCSMTYLIETMARYDFDGNVPLFRLLKKGSEGRSFSLPLG